MTPDALRKELAAGRLRPAYLLSGEELLLRDDTLAWLREAVLAGGPSDFNFDRLDGQTTTAGQLVDTVRALPIMAERRLVVLREPAEKRAAAHGLLDALAELVAEVARQPEAATVLVVVAAKPDRRARWVKAFETSACVVDCAPLRGGRALVGFVREEARRQGVELEGGAAELLVERIGSQLLVLRRELEKAALFAGPRGRVTREHVAVSTRDVAEGPIFDLTDAIGEGRTKDALRVLEKLIAAGSAPPLVLGALASHFRRLLRVRTGARVPGPPFAIRKLESQAQRYRPERLRHCLSGIHDCDEVLKGRGGIPQKLALERLVIGLSS
ncbi:MAG: DNA polymerase III subunit delta [Deltaproteobacteria bacterium]|nr:MAG: DNA polymerase III subunit delta [Deltaproteobacteria bacterium]